MCGDDTARLAGRMSLNPVVHIDPIGTIVFPLLAIMTGASFLFGWAKPVPVNPSRFQNYRRDDILVSLSGIGSNLLIALLAASAIRTILTFGGGGGVAGPIIFILRYLMYINVVLGVFNLVPIPPLDGSRVLYHYLPMQTAWRFQQFERYGFIILILFLMTGVFRFIINPPLQLFNLLAGLT
jgi:Zn-dependent protease